MTGRDARLSQLDRYLQMIVGDRRGDELLEIRHVNSSRVMRRTFFAANRPDRAARLIRSIAPRTDVYCGVLLRSRRAGGRDAVTDSHLVFVEIDAPDAVGRLARFAAPSMIVASGSHGHAHAYWVLRSAIAPAAVEHANRTLADHLGGDPASVDAARILRPAGTLSHKHRPPTPVELIRVEPSTRYDLAELLDGLAQAPTRPPEPTSIRNSAPRTELDMLLLAIPADTYVRELTGLEPRRDGKVNCPFHADDTPSLQLYRDATFYCYGCGAGGSVYDFAGRLWSLNTNGRAFLALRARLADRFCCRSGRFPKRNAPGKEPARPASGDPC